MLNEQYQFLESLGAGSYGEALLVLDTKQNIKYLNLFKKCLYVCTISLQKTI